MTTQLSINREHLLTEVEKLILHLNNYDSDYDFIHKELAKKLILSTENINLHDNKNPFIHDADCHLHQKMVELLSSIGVNMNAKDQMGNTVLHQMIANGQSRTMFGGLLETIQRLEKVGLDIHSKNNLGESLLFLLSYNMCQKDDDAILYLINKGVSWKANFTFNHSNPNFFENIGRNANPKLFQEIINIIKPKYNNINFLTSNNDNAGHGLAKRLTYIDNNHSNENIITLIDNGLNILQKNNQNITPLKIIKKSLPRLTTNIINHDISLLEAKRNNRNCEIKKSQFGKIVWDQLQKTEHLHIWKNKLEEQMLLTIQPKSLINKSSKKL